MFFIPRYLKSEFNPSAARSFTDFSAHKRKRTEGIKPLKTIKE